MAVTKRSVSSESCSRKTNALLMEEKLNSMDKRIDDLRKEFKYAIGFVIGALILAILF